MHAHVPATHVLALQACTHAGRTPLTYPLAVLPNTARYERGSPHMYEATHSRRACMLPLRKQARMGIYFPFLLRVSLEFRHIPQIT